jgi:hypothetical protein
MPHRVPRRTRLLAASASLFVLVALVATAPAATGANRTATARSPFLGQSRSFDADSRTGSVAPTAAQRATVAGLHASVRWNQFGTPESLIRTGGPLATGISGSAVAVARKFLRQHRGLFRLSRADVHRLVLVNDAAIGAGHAVLLQQRFGTLPAEPDGLVAVGVVDGAVTYVSSSIAGTQSAPAPPTLSAEGAVQAAAANVGRPVSRSDVTRTGGAGRRDAFKVKGMSGPVETRLVAVPTTTQGARAAYAVTLMASTGADPLGVQSYVDARTGQVLVRDDLIDYLADPSKWKAFPANPPLDYSTSDTRQLWCWEASDPGCQRILNNPASPLAWDIDPATGNSTTTTNGNNSFAVQKWNSNNGNAIGTVFATSRPGRDYTYDWTNQWIEQRCNPDNFSSPQQNDIDAALANLFAMHNRMHDFSYDLGFTEANFNMQRDNFGKGGLGNDPEQGNGQAGGVVGGPPAFASRNNANQGTPRDGLPGTTNMYLWQPSPGGFYPRCVDGDYDMSVIGHEYTHAISNRMVAGPNSGLSGFQGGSMGESWGDLNGGEYLLENGYIPTAGENPFAVGAYVTQNTVRGIRDYAMNDSPLNYSDLGFDLTGPEVHADGEIWNAVNIDVRQAMMAKYDATFPSSDASLQHSCADGLMPADQCPGNRRWIQLVYDAFLLIASGNTTMLVARDAMIAADMTRFGGANQDLIWNAFARRGFGEFASTTGGGDSQAVPSFESPYSDEAAVTFHPTDLSGVPVAGAQLFVGDFEARVVPVADTDPATALGDTVRLVPGTYHLIARANGFGAERFTLTVKAGQVRQFEPSLPPNLASSSNGATTAGDGTDQGALIDDTEATDWASLGSPVAGKQVTVRLDPSRPWWQVARVQVSALLRPQTSGSDPAQSRFSALRSFQLLSCEVKAGVTCANDADFHLLFSSPADAFPATVPRPVAPVLIMRSFDVPKTKATFVRLVVVTNQCTGTPGYAGDQDDDPANTTDCVAGSVQDENVRAAELQVFQK